jgi:hypothetical protein
MKAILIDPEQREGSLVELANTLAAGVLASAGLASARKVVVGER